MTTAAGLVNRSLQEIGAQASITGVNPTFDSTPYGQAAALLYQPAVNFLLRQQDWEFALNVAPLVSTVIVPPFPWSYEYVYPSDCMKVRQIYPGTWDVNDPQPITWTFVLGLWQAVERRLILTNAAAAVLVYTTNSITEDNFDPTFQEALVRLMASEFSMALAGRPDFSAKMLEWSGGITADGAGKDS